MRSIKHKKRRMSYINFARNCMIQLLTKKSSDDSLLSEISSEDIRTIENILNKYK